MSAADDKRPRMAKWNARANSPANVLLNQIVNGLNELEELALQFLDSHGSTCSCPFCGEPFSANEDEDDPGRPQITDGVMAEIDVRGLLYNVRASESIISGQIATLDPHTIKALSETDADNDEPIIVSKPR